MDLVKMLNFWEIDLVVAYMWCLDFREGSLLILEMAVYPQFLFRCV
jgi:hypothetical protein